MLGMGVTSCWEGSVPPFNTCHAYKLYVNEAHKFYIEKGDMQLARKFLIPNIFRLFNKPKESSSQMIFFFFVLSVVGMVPCPTRTGVCRVDL